MPLQDPATIGMGAGPSYLVGPTYGTGTASLHTQALSYMIRVSVHNGRTFVGPAYELTELTHLDVPGWKVLQVRREAPCA